MKTKIVNIFGVPGSGKSTAAAYVFSRLRLDGYDCELVRSYSNELVSGSNYYEPIEDQREIFDEQFYRQYLFKNEVPIVITDSPLLLCMYYDKNPYHEYNGFHEEVEESFLSFDNLNFMLYTDAKKNRKEEYAMTEFLNNRGFCFLDMVGTESGFKDAISVIKEILQC